MTDAKEFARAIFDLCAESGSADAVFADLALINDALVKHPEYKNLLDTPAVSKEEKLSLIDGAFGSLSEYAVNLLKVLCERHRVCDFCKILKEAEKLRDEFMGIERVEAITAISMTDTQISALRAKLEAITNKTVIITNKVDSALLGGVILRYSGVQLDGSVKTRLEDLRKSLSNIVM